MEKKVSVRYRMSKDSIPVTDKEQVIYTLVNLRAARKSLGNGRPANLALILDRSGSMDGEKIEHLKEAAEYVIDQLTDADYLSLVIFDDQVETLFSGLIAQNRDLVKNQLRNVIARGGTQISDALKAGMQEIQKGYARDRVNRMLIITDGQTWDDEQACFTLAEEASKQGIAITTIGIGTDWNEKLLLEMAEKSNGNSHWIQNPVSILEAFQEEVEGMQSVAAVNVKLTARMNDAVKPVKVYTAVPLISDISTQAVKGNTIVCNLGSLDGKKGQTILLESRITAKKEGQFRFGEVEIMYDMPSESISKETVPVELFLSCTKDNNAAEKVNAEVMNLVEKIHAFKLQTRGFTEAEAGNLVAATQKLQSAATVLLSLGEEGLARTAHQEISSLKKTGHLTAAGTKKLMYGTRKLTRIMTEHLK
ncbi:MAG: VWA domain-containing protein [Nitrospirota bacterium]